MVCYSWLLHSGLKYLLPSDSRILGFAENFEVIYETGDGLGVTYLRLRCRRRRIIQQTSFSGALGALQSAMPGVITGLVVSNDTYWYCETCQQVDA